MLAASPNPPDQDELPPLMPPPAPAAPPPSAAAAPAPAPGRIDREFVVKNRLVERYIGGRLPVRGAQDLERFCREHPDLLDEIALTDHINAALRLLDASGRASPWEPEPKKWWEQLWVPIAAATLALILGVTSLVLSGKLGGRDHTIAQLKQQVAQQPLEPTTSTRSITVMPSRVAPSRHSMATLGGAASAEMADLKIDVSWTPLDQFRVTMDRIDQGRVAIFHNLKRDSNGVLHLELNSSALGPGDYQLTIEGLDRWGNPIPQAWATISIVH
ncbi:MAG TPA: hypothetical protein VNZ06_09420 [Steroidobacteraceae bacterium]|jgi:hypothetical protein|nr:hypothetical protein [Steroidobacteraceae bacterium]